MKLLHALAALALVAIPLAATAPLSPASARIVIIRRGPPPLRHEVIVARPGPARDWFWQPGHWRWDGNDYDWVPGHWERRPHFGAVWVSGHWVHRHGEWIWIEGHWR